MSTWINYFAAIALALVVVGCGDPQATATDNPDIISVKTPGYHSYLMEVTLKDGVRCVVLQGGEGKSGVHCDWEGVYDGR